MPKEGSHYICLLVVLTDSFLKMDKSYYHQVLIEKHKYIAKEKEVT